MERAPRVAITGADGFLGSALTHALHGKGARLAPLRRNGGGSDLLSRPWRAEWPVERTAEVLADVDVVVHAAAHVPVDMLDPAEAERCLSVNALGTLRLAQAARSAGVRRFVLLSTSAFLERSDAPLPDDAFPTAPFRSAPYYAASKLLAEAWLYAVAADKMETLVVRPGSVYGPGMKGGVVSVLLERAQRGAPILLRDGGRHAADYVHVDDVAELTARGALSDMTGSLNAGTGVSTDLLGLSKAVLALFPRGLSAITVDPPDPDRPASGLPALDPQRARRDLGWSPRTLRQGLTDMLAGAAS